MATNIVISEYLNSRVDAYTHPEPNTGCWLWDGSVNEKGYPILQVQRNGVKKNIKVHRYNCVRFHGPIPDGLIVLHSCDNTICVSPHHVSAGTVAKNNQDMYRRGRRSLQRLARAA
jgi:hypothetical protein